MGLFLFTSEPLYSGELPIFAIGCIPYVAYEVTFPSVARKRRVVAFAASVIIYLVRRGLSPGPPAHKANPLPIYDKTCVVQVLNELDSEYIF